jgi:uncharacterized protein Yka (UPF0111/DUF47 family)
MRSKRKAAESDAARDILSYFTRNPDAVDGLESIARWRLIQERVQRTLEETQEALRWLVERGYLIESDTQATGALFQLNHEAVDEARRFLQKSRRKRR